MGGGGGGGRIRASYPKPKTQSRVCITVENSPNFPECLDEAMETRKKVLYCFYKIFLKDNFTNEGNN